MRIYKTGLLKKANLFGVEFIFATFTTDRAHTARGNAARHFYSTIFLLILGALFPF
jgi:hypothetical protein